VTARAGAGAAHLFVYGTLRRGAGASHLLAGCRFLREVSVTGRLFDVAGEYPALVLEGHGEVWGEVWAVPDGVLEALDRYEGVGEGLFARVRVEAGGSVCWTDVAGHALRSRLRPAAALRSGRWPPPPGP
jgi:gamma-glutamylcyclotransferase (GGCT)/AIG2-like uncharacterized protein YtfP